MAESTNEAVDELFESEESEEIQVEVEPVAEPPTEGETVGTKDKTEVEADKESEPPAEKEPTLVPIAALHDVRRKAKQLKEENEELRSQIPKDDEAPDPYDDIDAYDAYNRDKWQQEQNAEQSRVTGERLEISRNNMLQQHDDYVEMERIFEVMTLSDDSLVGRMLMSEDAGTFAYNTAKAYKASLFSQPEIKEPELSESDKRNKSAVNAPNLASATAQAPNTPQVEKEEGLMDIFEDQEW